jgi:acyl-CoA hydrolase
VNCQTSPSSRFFSIIAYFAGWNARFQFRLVRHTHSFDLVTNTPKFVTVNSTVQVDLFGRANSEMIAGRVVASPGGMTDFARPALKSEEGRSDIALRARRRNVIVPILLGVPVTSSRMDVDVIVTEFGAAQVRDQPLDRRAEAIIGLAAPEERAVLQEGWAAIRHKGFGDCKIERLDQQQRDLRWSVRLRKAHSETDLRGGSGRKYLWLLPEAEGHGRCQESAPADLLEQRRFRRMHSLRR